MKKNISINISGIIFHIEEDGYEILRKYLDSVNRYFASFEDSSEILADIESRIAELFLSKLNEGKQVITVEDVNSLIATMGSVSDFKAAEEKEFADGGATSSEQRQTTPPPARKLYRDGKRKILGGVCAGLGHYFNVDPVWPRILLSLLTLGTSGIFFLAYIVMWIVVPESELEEQATVKKMYRNPDKKVLGGVASGVSSFFGADTALVRFLFVLLAIFGGLGFVLYIILWIVLPEAKTITEKMEMQGEPVTLSNIESNVKRNLSDKGSEESVLTRIILLPFRALAALFNFLGPVFRVFIEVFRVAIGIVISLTGFLFVIAVLFCFGILVGLFAAPSWNLFSDWYISAPNVPLVAIRNSISGWTIFFAFLVAFIPSLFIMLIGNSIVAKRIVFNATVGWALFVVFFISVALTSFTLPQFIYGFKEKGEYRTEQTFVLNGKTPVLGIREIGLDDYNVTSLFLKPYDGKDIKVIKRFESQGSSRKQAIENAKMVGYEINQRDSVITFDSNITFQKDAKFRAQRLDVDILVPTEQKMVIDASLWRLIDTDVIYGSGRYRYSLNEDTHQWKFTTNGLECVDCTELTNESTLPQDQFGFTGFNSVELSGIFNARIVKGDNYAVELDASPSVRKRYDVYMNGETLIIEYRSNNKLFWKRDLIGGDEVQITVTMPNLRELDVKGAGRLRFRGFDEEEVDIKLMGAVVGDGDLHAGTLHLGLTGASFLDLSGSGRFMEADLVGASGLRAYGYEVGHCVVEAHGASSARVHATETLEISKGVASSVSHKGNPEVIRR